MKCPFCNSIESKVVDSRPTEDGSVIRRRRECIQCLKRFTTYEKIEDIPLMVIKKNGHREPYNQNKIMNGALKACEKRPVSLGQLEKIVERIEKRLYNTMEKEISSNYIGEQLMMELKELDEVAYVRFASVYRQFKDINTFMEELNILLKEK
ncbi:transcriptional regulator NrdR [Irregularibacter muris]|uniref:Transcriptional repressor NrdR n=1 Tax=Irregularibacter muris TaxID=1796619 RepID=A0AAE3HCW8_9FIRM|nr:transcriptional regulator NrdR [Irregularibacter muris]MCR1898030.1 transcriptional regulator NrdR [Irregularibacter muris]